MHTIGGTTTTTDYCGNAVYENGELKMLLNDAGYVSFPDKQFHFYIKDHQGNVRVVADAEGNVEEVNDYYPFGGLMSNATENDFQKYKYNGKELDRKAGLNWYDYGARFYDPGIGKFMTIDPMSEKYYQLGLYGYCADNPLKYIDLDGCDIVIVGKLRNEALRQLQSAVGKTVLLTMNDGGKVGFALDMDKKLNSNARQLMKIISDNSIQVNLITTDGSLTSNGQLMVGGAFMGNTITKSNGRVGVEANQEINPNTLGTADKHTDTPGKMIMHEATEAYEGAKISQKRGTSSSMAGHSGSVYSEAHAKATPQSPVLIKMYDEKGNITSNVNEATKVTWSVVNGNGEEKVIQILEQ